RGNETGSVLITVNNVTYAVNLTDGVAVLNVTLPVGDYTASVYYAGDDKYNATSNATAFNVAAKGTSAIIIDVENVYYVGQEIVITFTPVNSTGNLKVTINGEDYEITDNKVTFENGLANGTYVIVAVLDEDESYYGSSANATFLVVKNDITISVNNITVPSIIYADNQVNITANLNETVTGDVIFTINGVDYIVHIIDSNVATIEYTPVNNDTITVVATFMGNDKYNSNVSDPQEFTVNRIPTDINVTVETPVTYGDDAVITVCLNVTINATAKLSVDGKEYNVALIDGKGVFNASGLGTGVHDVIVTYVGDRIYDRCDNSTSFTIDNATLIADVTAFNVTVEQNTTFVVNVTDDFEGNVSIKVGDKVLYNGSVKTLILADILPAGDKTATVVFYGDSNYDELTLDVNFTVSSVAPSIDVTIDDVTYPDNATAVINVGNNANGTVKVTVDGKVFNGTVSNGVANVVLTNLSAGSKVVTVEFISTDDYNDNATASAKFTVLKATPEMDVEVQDVVYYSPETIIVTVNATGNVTIKVNNQTKVVEQELQSGEYRLVLDGLAAGQYVVEVTYNGNENYTNVTKTTVFNVIKANTTLDVEFSSVYVNETQVLNITVNNTNATGNVIIIIDGNNYTETLANGRASFTTDLLPYGNHTLTVIYEGDKNLTGSWISDTFEVSKLQSNLTISVTNVTTASDETIEVSVTPGATGSVVITVDGKDYHVDLDNGVATLVLSNLANKTYTVHAKYLGDENYTTCEGDASFNVAKVNSEVSVQVENITVGDVAVVNITVTPDATGNVTVEIVGVGTYTVPVANGTGSLIVKDLAVDNYTVKVTYNGDGKYLPSDNETTFKVSKAETTSGDIQVVDQGNRTVVINVPGKEGNVTVKVGNETYNATVVNGTAVVTLTNTTPGEHEIEVIYSGDENHTGASTNANVTIPKYPTPMSIEVSDGKVDEKIKVTVNVPDGLENNVTIEIDGKTYSAKPENGKAVFEIEGLLSGNKTVTAIYEGDHDYESNSTTANFTVYKNPAPISATADNSTPGSATIEVTLPSDATGYVIVNVNGTDYGINLTAGDKSVTIPIMKSGDYTAVVTYLGDEKYLDNSTTINFHASSNKTSPNIAADVEDVPVGNDVVVTVTVPQGGDGNVTITVDNITTTVPVTGGENNISIPGVSEGTHDVVIQYSGNDQYEPQTITKKVTVFKSIIAEDLTRGWNSPYDYKAEFLDNEGHVLADTDVKFIVNGKTYTVKTDSQGIARLDKSKLPIGEYEVTIINPVTGEQTTAKTTIVKRLIENKDITMDFVDGTYYVVRAIGDDGKPVGEGEFVQISVHTISYSCKTDKDGYARLKINLNPDKYPISAEYKNYKVQNNIVVKQTLKLVKKTVKVKKGKKLVLKAKLKWSNGKAIKGKKIVFKFKGKKYSAKTNSKGIAKVTIKKKVTKKLKKGKKYKYSAKYLTNGVKGKVKVKK
ncbi:Ig-like domain-containing protein, partial [Methanobrevibacter sp.]|uniref:beta strand repeat-containing protein n=1 Tax=Methanobrevibacter sp. TaxID=66852 RepID=UPI0025E8EA95